MIRWALAVAFGVLLLLGVCRLAKSQPPELGERVEVWLERHAPAGAVEPNRLASAIARATTERQWAALLLTVARHESAFSARIAAGHCRAHECDNGLAWGLWQLHQTSTNAPAWGSTEPSVQAQWASYTLHGMDAMCNRAGVSFPLGVLRAYGTGRGCRHRLRDERARLATYREILKQL